MPDAEISAAAGNPGCGDVVTVYLKTAPDSDRIAAATFEGSGCTISQGAASLLLQEINRDHPTLSDVLARPLEDHVDLVGREVVGFRERCAAVAFDALQHAVRSLEAERKLIAAGYSAAEARTMRQRAQRG
jgi:nitrogen fixation NifU-like protein